MPWIEVIQEHEAKGNLKEAYVKMHEVNSAYGESLGGGILSTGSASRPRSTTHRSV